MFRKSVSKRRFGSGSVSVPLSVESQMVNTPHTDEMIRAVRQLLQLLDTHNNDATTMHEMRTLHYSMQPVWELAFGRFPMPDFTYPDWIWRPRLQENAETILAVLQSGTLTARLDPIGEELQHAEKTEGHAKFRFAHAVADFFRNRSLWENVVSGLIVAGLIFLGVKVF